MRSNVPMVIISLDLDIERACSNQNLIRRDSSIVIGANGYSLNPDYVKKVDWWEHDLFKIKKYLIAAELIAFKQLNPIIRSQSNTVE